MAYIGRGTENISNVEVLDNLTFNGSASYTLQKSSTNFVPSSANNLLISISGVVQQGNFSVSGSTITFDTTVASSDTCDWILHYGTGLITTVADGAITEAKLGSNAVTTAKITDGTITNAKLANSSVTVNGTSINLGASGTISAGITEADVWRLTTSFSGGSANITSNWERADDASSGLLGTGMTQSSGAFSFPSTGIWSIRFTANYNANNTDDRAIKATINISSDSGSNYDLVSQSYTHIPDQSVGEVYSSSTAGAFVDVTSTSTFRALFGIASLQSNVNYLGSSTYNQTWVEFIRLGDT